MTTRERLKALVAALPAEATVTVAVGWLADLLAEPEGPVATAGAGLLTVDQAAARLGWSKDYLYRRGKALPFARKLSHRVLRFDPVGLEEWLRDQTPINQASPARRRGLG